MPHQALNQKCFEVVETVKQYPLNDAYFGAEWLRTLADLITYHVFFSDYEFHQLLSATDEEHELHQQLNVFLNGIEPENEGDENQANPDSGQLGSYAIYEHLNRHIGENSTYSSKDELIDTIKQCYLILTKGKKRLVQLQDNQESDQSQLLPLISNHPDEYSVSNVEDSATAKVVARKLAHSQHFLACELIDDISECTQGFHERGMEALINSYIPSNIAELLQQIRNDQVHHAATRACTSMHHGPHTLADFKNKAAEIGRGVLPMDVNGAYRGVVAEENIPPLLDIAFKYYDTVGGMLHLCIEKLKLQMTKYYAYHGLDNTDGYPNGDYEVMLSALSSIIVQQKDRINYANLQLDDTGKVVDINWDAIKYELFEVMLEQQYFSLSERQLTWTRQFYNGDENLITLPIEQLNVVIPPSKSLVDYLLRRYGENIPTRQLMLLVNRSVFQDEVDQLIAAIGENVSNEFFVEIVCLVENRLNLDNKILPSQLSTQLYQRWIKCTDEVIIKYLTTRAHDQRLSFADIVLNAPRTIVSDLLDVVLTFAENLPATLLQAAWFAPAAIQNDLLINELVTAYSRNIMTDTITDVEQFDLVAETIGKLYDILKHLRSMDTAALRYILLKQNSKGRNLLFSLVELPGVEIIEYALLDTQDLMRGNANRRLQTAFADLYLRLEPQDWQAALTHQDNQGLNFLMAAQVAGAKGAPQILEQFHSDDFDVKQVLFARDTKGRNAFHIACNNIETFQLYLDALGQCSIEQQCDVLTQPTAYGNTLLQHLLIKAHSNNWRLEQYHGVLSQLLSHIKLNQVDIELAEYMSHENINGENAFFLAATTGPQTLLMLLQQTYQELGPELQLQLLLKFNSLESENHQCAVWGALLNDSNDTQDLMEYIFTQLIDTDEKRLSFFSASNNKNATLLHLAAANYPQRLGELLIYSAPLLEGDNHDFIFNYHKKKGSLLAMLEGENAEQAADVLLPWIRELNINEQRRLFMSSGRSALLAFTPRKFYSNQIRRSSLNNRVVPSYKESQFALAEIYFYLKKLEHKVEQLHQKTQKHVCSNHSVTLAYEAAKLCHTQLSAAMEVWSNSEASADDIVTLQASFLDAVSNAEPQLSQHRGIKNILVNCLLMVSGVGLLYLLARSAYRAYKHRPIGFFANTNTASKNTLNELKQAVVSYGEVVDDEHQQSIAQQHQGLTRAEAMARARVELRQDVLAGLGHTEAEVLGRPLVEATINEIVDYGYLVRFAHLAQEEDQAVEQPEAHVQPHP